MLQPYSGLPGVKCAVYQAALDGRILFFSSLNYSRQILEHSFKNGACPPSSTSFPNHSSLTMVTAQQTGTYTKEIKVAIRIVACTLCRMVTESTHVWTELLKRKILFCSRRGQPAILTASQANAMAPRQAWTTRSSEQVNHRRRTASSPECVAYRLNLNLEARWIPHSYVTAQCASLKSVLNKRH